MMSPGMGELLCMCWLTKLNAESTDAKALPNPAYARWGRELGYQRGENQYSVGNRTLVLERSCSVMIHTRPSGDSGTS